MHVLLLRMRAHRSALFSFGFGAGLVATGLLAWMRTLPAAMAAGALSTLMLLIAAHLALWPYRNRMPRPASYIVGTSCSGAGLLLFSSLTDLWIVFIAFVAILLPGGLSIIAAWWLRSVFDTLPADSLDLDERMREGHAVRRKPDHRNN
ncbi:MAG: hypothetical protein IPP13_21770 [Kouleothrix sp.]|jgi:hypothetical protein|nr:hypothetical protein [Kouleothrix sp.]